MCTFLILVRVGTSKAASFYWIQKQPSSLLVLASEFQCSMNTRVWTLNCIATLSLALQVFSSLQYYMTGKVKVHHRNKREGGKKISPLCKQKLGVWQTGFSWQSYHVGCSSSRTASQQDESSWEGRGKPQREANDRATRRHYGVLRGTPEQNLQQDRKTPCWINQTTVRVSDHDCTGEDRARRDPDPVTYGEGPVAEEGGEVPELEREAHGEHDEAERGGVGPRRQRHEPPERRGPRDGYAGAGRDVGRVQPRRGRQRRVPPRRRRGRGCGGPGAREALDLEEGGKVQAPPGEGTRGPWPRCDPGGGAPSGDGAEAEGEREEEGSHGGRWRGRLPARGGWFLSRARTSTM